jgi:hypothetical protein
MSYLRVLLLLALLAGGAADAFPHFQLSTGNATCQSCHEAPAGGRLLTEFGRDQSEDPLSAFGGSGGLLHGLVKLPGWVNVGGDFRFAGLVNDNGQTEGIRTNAFPMQADLAVRIGPEILSATVVIGLRGTARGEQRPPDSNLPPPPPTAVISREHYLTARLPDSPLYARVGRFYAPFGLRLADHTTYIRRYLDLNLEQETYNVSAGSVSDDWELHGTAFALEPFAEGGVAQYGGVAMAELRIGTDATVGLSGRLGIDPDGGGRQIGGAFGKWWIDSAKLMWMAELDYAHQSFSGGFPSRSQLVAYAGPVWMPTNGLSLGAAYESFAEDLSTAGTTRHAAYGFVSYLPWPHVELMVSSRYQFIGATERAWNVLAQLHYSL